MPNQVDGAFVRAPCPVPSCPACEPNTGSVHPNLPAKAARVEASRHCYAIKWVTGSRCPVIRLVKIYRSLEAKNCTSKATEITACERAAGQSSTPRNVVGKTTRTKKTVAPALNVRRSSTGALLGPAIKHAIRSPKGAIPAKRASSMATPSRAARNGSRRGALGIVTTLMPAIISRHAAATTMDGFMQSERKPLRFAPSVLRGCHPSACVLFCWQPPLRGARD